MIAEDESLIRLDLAEMLTEEGYDVVGEAGDGERAVALAREYQPDLVVMDVKMPRLDGIEAARVISAEQLAPVVMLTAFSQRELVARAAEAGAMAYIVKPFSKSDLVPAIELARSRYREFTALSDEVRTLEDRLEARKTIEQAKGVLQDQIGLSESDAFSWLQRAAMDKRMSMKDVALKVISERGHLGGSTGES